MKKLLLSTVSVLCTVVTFAQFGTLPNGDFEAWTTDTLYSNTDIWQTGNYEWGTTFITTTQDNDAQNGNYSVRMESIIVGNDTAFGYVMLGNFGDTMPDQGYPYTDNVDTLKGWYKCDMQTGDSATVLMVMMNADTITEMNAWLIPGTQSTWKEFIYSFNPNLVAPDSILIAFASSNVLNDVAVDGSWLMVDNVSFTSSVVNTPAAIPNGDFENWIPVISENADNWNSYNDFFATSTSITPVKKTTDNYGGTYAVELTTYSFNNDSDTIVGILTNGDINYWGSGGGIPYTATPDTFYGQYKYAPAGTDTAFIFIEFMSNSVTIDQQMVMFPASASSYTPFGVGLNVGSTPDSMRVSAFSGGLPGSVLKLDDLTLAGGDVGIQLVMSEQTRLKMYPNPAENKVYLEYNLTEASGVTVRVYDITGKQVISARFGEQRGEQRISLDIDDLNSGMYFVTVAGNKETITRKLMVK